MTKNLVLTQGLPRSGKSTWAREQGVPIVNPDAIRLALYGQRWIQEAEPMVWSLATYMVRSLFLAGHDVVILEATSVTHGRRDQWLSSDWKPFVKIFRTPAEECERRAMLTEQEDLIPVIRRMVDDWQEPSEQWTVIESLEEINEN